ncbi:MAG: SDR family oxidoreductase [Chloroflexi bacterium]|nr:SDR family oxidoreductase [Chloroflexota bacterium]
MKKPINEQVVVITGASSGIGRAAALKFGQAGAAVVLAARNEEALQDVAGQIRRLGGQALVVPTDVSQWEQVEALARQAYERFGRIDTWVNDASVALYGTVEQVTVQEIDRVIEVNLLGVVHGVKAALPYITAQQTGTIINIGSVLSRRAIPLQSAYVAAKFGVRGFTDSLRLELERDHPGIDVTLIMPSSMNTPFFSHARSRMGVMPQPIPPVYSPERVADAILYAAQHSKRDMLVGGAGLLFSLLEKVSPSLADRFMLAGGNMFVMQKTSEPDDNRDNLFAPMVGRGRIEGQFNYLVKPSLYTRLVTLAPTWRQVLLPAALAVLALFGIRRRQSDLRG